MTKGELIIISDKYFSRNQVRRYKKRYKSRVDTEEARREGSEWVLSSAAKPINGSGTTEHPLHHPKWTEKSALDADLFLFHSILCLLMSSITVHDPRISANFNMEIY